MWQSVVMVKARQVLWGPDDVRKQKMPLGGAESFKIVGAPSTDENVLLLLPNYYSLVIFSAGIRPFKSLKGELG